MQVVKKNTKIETKPHKSEYWSKALNQDLGVLENSIVVSS